MRGELALARMRSRYFLVCVGAALVVAAVALLHVGDRFAFGISAKHMPIVPFVAAFTISTLACLGLLKIIPQVTCMRRQEATGMLLLIFSAGFLARLLLLPSEPVLEADFNRYLWDGGLTANGLNPYAVAPARIRTLSYNDIRVELSNAAIPIFERISYPELKTIYPPTAQAAFALAYWIEPWSLAAWRGVCIAADSATFVLLVLLLRALGRSDLYVVLYWWHPLVVKEIVNSAHMEAILIPFVLGALLLSLRGRHIPAVATLGLAVGAKLWPIMLAPLLLRPLWRQPVRLAGALCLLFCLLAAMALPVLLGGLDATSGFVGFARDWSTNSALFPILQRLASAGLGAASMESVSPGAIARGFCAIAVAMLAIAVVWRPIADVRDHVLRAYLIVSVVLLLSPAQFPWYVLWVLPLATLLPGNGWHVAAALMPIYYLSFHFLARGAFKTYEPWICAAIWVPVWLTLAWDVMRSRNHHAPGVSNAQYDA